MSSSGVLGTGIADVGGGILGNILSAGDQQKALDAQLAALQGFQNLNPTLQQVNFQGQQSVGSYNPNLESTFQQGPNALAGIQSNPAYMSAQNNALQGLQQVAQNGGLTTIDKANLNNMLSQSAQQNAGQQGAIQQQMAARGMGGSGFQLAAQMAGQQNSANQANQAATNVAGQAQMRALQAMQGAGNLGQSMQAQQYGQQANAANAQNLINQFNTMNSQNVANTNTQNQNQGQLYNLQQGQTIANNNANMANQQQLQNNNYQQQYYNNQLGKQQAIAGQQNGLSNYYQGSANRTAGTINQAAQGAGQVYGAYDQMNSQKGNDDSSGGGSGAGIGAMAGMAALL